jgi:hypothetical protein
MSQSFSSLIVWAREQVEEDFNSVQRQITEYGAIDLEMMGMGLLEQSRVGKSPDTACGDPMQAGIEMALVFYLQGKIARCVSAISAGKMPSDDTLKDLRVYAFMLGHVRHFGHWKIDPDVQHAERSQREETATERLVRGA